MKFLFKFSSFLKKKYDKKTVRQKRILWTNTLLYFSFVLASITNVIYFGAGYSLILMFAFFISVLGVLTNGDFFVNLKRVIFRDRLKAGDVVYLKSINHGLDDRQLFSAELDKGYNSRKEAIFRIYTSKTYNSPEEHIDNFEKCFPILQKNDLDKVFLVVEDEHPELGLASLFSSTFDPFPYDGLCPKVKILHEKGVYWANPKIFKRMKVEKHDR